MKIRDLKILGSTSGILEGVLDSYTEYVGKIGNLTTKQLTTYLRTMRAQELIDNQNLDNEDSFMITAYNLTNKNTSIKVLEKIFSDEEPIKVKDLNLSKSEYIKVMDELKKKLNISKEENIQLTLDIAENEQTQTEQEPKIYRLTEENLAFINPMIGITQADIEQFFKK